jgi:alginate O-acetyltransferase complex protein AlgJ
MKPLFVDPLALPPVPPEAAADHPHRDRLLVAFFALAIALPFAGAIGKRNLTTTAFEKRTAAAWPSMPADAKSARAWPPAFERAFADRFGGRDRLIAVHHAAKALGFGVSPVDKVLIGRDGWLYFLGEDGRAIDRDWRGTYAYDADEPRRVAAEFKRRRDWLSARGIGYVVMIVPDKATIYPEHLPSWVRQVAPVTRLDRLYAALGAYPEVAALDLRPALRAAKLQQRLYFKTDSHWNYAGATVAYETLMPALRAQLEQLPFVPAERPPYQRGEDVYSGDLAHMLGLPRRFEEDDVAPLGKVLANASARCAQHVDAPPPDASETGRETYECARPGPRALLLRDSMGSALVPPLVENFARTVVLSTRHLDPALVADERPDIVIEELVERMLHAPLAFPM